MPRWEKGKGYFKSNHVVGLVFLHRVEYTLQGGSLHPLVLWSVWECNQVLMFLAHYIVLISIREGKAFSCQVRLIHKENMICSAFKLQKLAAHHQCTASVAQHYGLFSPCLGWKKARDDFRRNCALGLVFFEHNIF